MNNIEIIISSTQSIIKIGDEMYPIENQLEQPLIPPGTLQYMLEEAFCE